MRRSLSSENLELDTAVLSLVGGAGVGNRRPVLAVAGGGKPGGGNTLAHQIVVNGLGPALAEALVVASGAIAVGVTHDSHPYALVGDKCLGHGVQEREAFSLDVGAVHIEVDVAEAENLALHQFRPHLDIVDDCLVGDNGYPPGNGDIALRFGPEGPGAFGKLEVVYTVFIAHGGADVAFGKIGDADGGDEDFLGFSIGDSTGEYAVAGHRLHDEVAGDGLTGGDNHSFIDGVVTVGGYPHRYRASAELDGVEAVTGGDGHQSGGGEADFGVEGRPGCGIGHDSAKGSLGGGFEKVGGEHEVHSETVVRGVTHGERSSGRPLGFSGIQACLVIAVAKVGPLGVEVVEAHGADQVEGHAEVACESETAGENAGFVVALSVAGLFVAVEEKTPFSLYEGGDNTGLVFEAHAEDEHIVVYGHVYILACYHAALGVEATVSELEILAVDVVAGVGVDTQAEVSVVAYEGVGAVVHFGFGNHRPAHLEHGFLELPDSVETVIGLDIGAVAATVNLESYERHNTQPELAVVGGIETGLEAGDNVCDAVVFLPFAGVSSP